MSTRVRLYRHGKLQSEDFPLAKISDYLKDADAVVWLDICQPRPEDFAVISEEFGLHGLAVEDALHEHQRPKLDRYDNHLFMAAYDVVLHPHTNELAIEEVDAFITKQALITVREHPAFDIDDIVKRWDDNAHLTKYGVGFLLWGLLDHIVDRHFEAAQLLDDKVEELENTLFSERKGRDKTMQRRSYEFRKNLVQVRRVVLPMREVVNSLIRRDLRVVEAGMQPYYQDVYDHILRASEWTDSMRDLASTIFETNLSLQDNRLNEIMKKLTAYAAIVAVPTAVTGFYGQNVPYPGFGQHWGVVTSVAIIVAIASVLFVAFKHNDWL